MSDWITSSLTLVVCLIAASGTACLAAPEEPPLPAGGTSMLSDEALKATRVAPAKENEFASHETIAVGGMPFAKAIRARVQKRPERARGVTIGVNTTGAIAKGDVCALVFWIRGPESADESGDAIATAFVQRNQQPWEKVIQAPVTANKEWQRVVVAARVGQALPDGGSNIVFHLGHHPQTVEIGGLQLINYGQHMDLKAIPQRKRGYKGGEDDAPWRPRPSCGSTKAKCSPAAGASPTMKPSSAT